MATRDMRWSGLLHGDECNNECHKQKKKTELFTSNRIDDASTIDGFNVAKTCECGV